MTQLLADKPNNDSAIKMHQLLYRVSGGTMLTICFLQNATRLTKSFARM